MGLETLLTAVVAYITVSTQRIGRMAVQISAPGEAEAKLAVFGALKLYLASSLCSSLCCVCLVAIVKT